MKLALTAKLTNNHPSATWPAETTLGGLVALARRRLGKAYAGTFTATYGGGTQVEVRGVKHGYHGREIVRRACYAIVAT